MVEPGTIPELSDAEPEPFDAELFPPRSQRTSENFQLNGEVKFEKGQHLEEV